MDARRPRPPVTVSGLLFRFGFICLPAAGHPRGDEVWARVIGSWKRFDVGDLVVYHDPETPVRCRRAPTGAGVLIGEAFATPAGRSVESVIDALVAAETDDLFFEQLDALSGRFALLILTDSAQRVFHDPIGSRSIFYLAQGGMCIGSHAELIARGFGLRPDPAAQEIAATEEYRSRSVKYLPGDLTMYENLRALAPNNYYDIGGRRTARYWPRHPRAPASFGRFFGALDDHLVALVDFLRGNYSPIVGITAGIDSRVIAAAFSRYDLPFYGVTWVRRKGGYLRRTELERIGALAARAGVEHTYLKLGPPEGDLKRVARVANRNAGNLRRSSPITARMHERFAVGRRTFVRGWGAEIIRGFYNLTNARPRVLYTSPALGRLRVWTRRIPSIAARLRPGPISAMTASELLRAYNSSMRKTHAGVEHTRLGLAAFEGFIERANYDHRVTRFGFDLNDLFYWEHRMGMWGSAMHNEMDAAVLSIVGFNSRTVYEVALGLSARERLTRELLRRVARRYDAPMAELPYS